MEKGQFYIIGVLFLVILIASYFIFVLYQPKPVAPENFNDQCYDLNNELSIFLDNGIYENYSVNKTTYLVYSFLQNYTTFLKWENASIFVVIYKDKNYLFSTFPNSLEVNVSNRDSSKLIYLVNYSIIPEDYFNFTIYLNNERYSFNNPFVRNYNYLSLRNVSLINILISSVKGDNVKVCYYKPQFTIY